MLRLGRREDIRLVGLYPDSCNGGQLTAKCHDGFLWPDGRKHMINFRLGTADKEEAKRKVVWLLNRLHEQWDRVSAAVLNGPVSASVLSFSPNTTIRQLVAANCIRMEEAGMNPPLLANYRAEAQAFLRLAGPLADMPPAALTLDQCCQIRDGRLAELDLSCACFSLRIVLRLAFFRRQNCMIVFVESFGQSGSASNAINSMALKNFTAFGRGFPSAPSFPALTRMATSSVERFNSFATCSA